MQILQPGRVLNYRDRGDENRRACSLYLSLMDRMGVPLRQFGDADSRLDVQFRLQGDVLSGMLTITPRADQADDSDGSEHR